MKTEQTVERLWLRPSKWSVRLFKLQFILNYLFFPIKQYIRQLKHNSYMLATLSSVNIEFINNLSGINKDIVQVYRPPIRVLNFSRLKGLRQIPIRNASDFLKYFRASQMLVVDITPSTFSGATMDSRISMLIGMAKAKALPIYYIRAEDILPFIERQRNCMKIPHQSMLVKDPNAIEFSNLAELIEEC